MHSFLWFIIGFCMSTIIFIECFKIWFQRSLIGNLIAKEHDGGVMIGIEFFQKDSKMLKDILDKQQYCIFRTNDKQK